MATVGLGPRAGLALIAILSAVIALAPSQAAGAGDSLAAMVERVRHAVVEVVVVRPPMPTADDQVASAADSTHQASSETNMTAIGSGFVLDQDGYIATNKHVVKDAIAVFVVTNDSVRHQARVIGTTHNADIALIKVEGWKDMPFVPLGDSDKLAVGQQVVAIGSPFGFVGSASTGIVSAVNRDIMESPFDDYIQTDAAINHGNSGGALFNTDGQVIGMTSVIIAPGTGSVGLGFAIPSNDLAFVIARMKANNGKVSAGMLPLRTQPVTWMLAQAVGSDSLQGALVAGLDETGDQMMDGQIKPGDIVLAFNGRTVWDPRDLARKAAESPVGSAAELDIQRGDQRIKVHVKVQPYPDDPTPPAQMHKPRDLGLTLASVAGQGVAVSDIDMMGSAADSGIQKGDVILQVQQHTVSNPDQALQLFEAQRAKHRPFAAVLVLREGKPTWIAVACP